MEATGKQKIQIVLTLLIVVVGLRAAYIVYERHADREEAAREEKRAAPPLNADYYVTPKRLRPYDLKSARQLSQQPVWVKEGYRYSYYAYNSVRRRSDFSHPVGVLLPIEELQIKDVSTDLTPGAADQKQVIAIFEKEGKTYSVPIGTVAEGDYQIYSDEMFYMEDPRELYKHWPADIWESVAKHEVKPGMNELQADFAIGMGMPEHSADSSSKTVHYPNGGSPVTITYRNGKAAEIIHDKS
jgi:hypothetical protein